MTCIMHSLERICRVFSSSLFLRVRMIALDFVMDVSLGIDGMDRMVMLWTTWSWPGS